MTSLRRALAVIVGAGVLLAGCTAAAHLRVLQVRAMPSASPAPGARDAPATPPADRTGMQLGIDLDASTYPGQDVAAAARTDISYIRSLHANAVAISFPFFVGGPGDSTVYAASATPTPAQLAIVARDAMAAGLRVTVRPLLDQSSIRGLSRTLWVPPHLQTWLASYERFLTPYAAMASRLHIATLVVGAELTLFSRAPGWAGLDTDLHRYYRGGLACSDNWGRPHLAGNCGPGVQQELDAYQPLRGDLAAGWKAFDHALPRGTVLAEVGIAAVAGAFVKPYDFSWPASQLDPAMQAQWFTDACQAARAERLGGIYFWSLGLSSQLSEPALNNQGSWANSAGAHAISSCFRQLSRPLS